MIPFLCIITGLDIEFHFYECHRMTGQEEKILKNGSERASSPRSWQQTGRKKNPLNLESFSALRNASENIKSGMFQGLDYEKFSILWPGKFCFFKCYL